MRNDLNKIWGGRMRGGRKAQEERDIYIHINIK